MKTGKSKALTLLATTACLLTAASTHAATVVSRIDADTLRVIHTEGKPPFKREIISESRSPERFAYYAEKVDALPRAVYASEVRRIPGKQMASSTMHVTSDPGALVDFARFEETAEEPRNHRRPWRGAPGKRRY